MTRPSGNGRGHKGKRDKNNKEERRRKINGGQDYPTSTDPVSYIQEAMSILNHPPVHMPTTDVADSRAETHVQNARVDRVKRPIT